MSNSAHPSGSRPPVVLELEAVRLDIPVFTTETRSLKASLVRSATGGGLSRRAGGAVITALENVTCTIWEGERVALIGHNGAGKTTTINMLVGNLNVSSGRASVMGLNVKSQMRSINQVMGVCPQHDILWPALTGEEHLELFCRLRGFTE